MHKHTATLADLQLSSCRAAAYTLGPIDSATLCELQVRFDESHVFQLLTPGPDDLPVSLLADPDFRKGCLFGYGNSEGFASFSPVQLANYLHRDWCANLHAGDASYAWCAGHTLGLLSGIAEEDRLLALVGIAHFCFLLACVPHRSHPAFDRMLQEVSFLHNIALRAYRERVRALKAGGMAIEEAWRLALCPQWQAV